VTGLRAMVNVRKNVIPMAPTGPLINVTLTLWPRGCMGAFRRLGCCVSSELWGGAYAYYSTTLAKGEASEVPAFGPAHKVGLTLMQVKWKISKIAFRTSRENTNVLASEYRPYSTDA